MKIVYSWLNDFIDLTGDLIGNNVNVQKISDALASAGIEVASVAEISIPQGVKVARVVSREQHPNADKLSLCKVDDGSGGEPVQIVCGAPNVRADMVVALATVGTQIAPDFKIGKAKIRGVESFGMMCSEKELGLSDNHAGIMSLPEDYKIGTPLSDYIPYDAVIEIEITPNRGDCLSVLGVARELSAKLGLPLKDTAKRPLEDANDAISSAISVDVENAGRCPRYLGRLIRNVVIRQSPEWMRKRLTLAGLRPINNVVDITNYILIQYGQPMHAFDYNAIADKKIIVKTAESIGVTAFTTLDGVERKLVGDDLLICDGSRPVALAGVMGGAGSEIKDDTKDVFLECAFFEQGGVRKTSKRLGLSTDSSYRFERGVDPAQGLVDAIDTAAELIRELADGAVSSGIIDTQNINAECGMRNAELKNKNPFEDKIITLRPSEVKKILGVEISADDIISMLSPLGIKALKESDGALRCTAPLFRHDIHIEADLIEEVGRVYGYDNIPAAATANIDLVRQPCTAEINRDKARHALCFFGFNEIMTNSMVQEAKRKAVLPDAEPVRIMNPLNPDMAEMRASMAGSLLETIAYNLNHKNRNNRFFEIGKTFRPANDGPGLAVERDILAIAVEGSCFPQSWNSAELPNGFFVLKGIIEAFAANCGLGTAVFTKVEEASSGKPDGTAGISDCNTNRNTGRVCKALSGPLYGPERAAVAIGGGIIGSIGRVSDEARKAFGIKSDVFYAGLDLTDWLAAPKPLPKYDPLPKFPPLSRDFSFVMPETLPSDTISHEISRISELVKDVRPFDVYKGEKIAAGTKSVTFSVEFRSPEKTLTDDDVAGACGEIISTMEKKHGAALRK